MSDEKNIMDSNGFTETAGEVITIYGAVGPNGNREVGQNFISSRSAVGTYDIIFQGVNFSETPVVVVSPNMSGHNITTQALPHSVQQNLFHVSTGWVLKFLPGETFNNTNGLKRRWI